MDSGLGSSSVEDVATVEAPAVADSDQTVQQQREQEEEQVPPDCCQMAMAEGGDCAKCGEMRSLDDGLVEELNRVFEGRLRIVEQYGNDSHQKIALYEDWVKQLRLINLEVVGTIKEMQDTCRDRLDLMRANYKKNLARFGPETLRRLECDKNSLVEVIRRACATGKWDVSGIKLYDVSLDQLFGTNNAIRDEAPAAEKIEGPTISVNLEVSSNCQLENTKVEELLQELADREKQIKHLEHLLEQQLPMIDGSPNDTESDIRSEDCAAVNAPLMNQLRQLINRKDQELQQQSAHIDELCTEITNLKSKFEEMDLSSQQFNSDLSPSLSEFKMEDSDASNRKLLQQLKNLSRVKSEQLDAVNRENEELRKEVKSLQAKASKQSNRDNESLVNEINDHHDKNCRLEKRLREVEQLLREANSAVAHRQKVIDTLRRDKIELQKSLGLAAVTGQAIILHKSVSNPSIDTASIGSSESTISFGSVKSDSSSGTVKAQDSEQEVEHIQRLKSELAIMSEQLQRFQQTKHDQEDIIAEQKTRLNASEVELKVLRNDYENNMRKLFFIRAEVMRLIEEIVKNLKGHLKLPSTVQSIDAFLSQPVIGNNSTEEECSKDAAILERLKQYLDAIVKSYIVVTKEREDLCTIVDLMKERINALQREKEHCECLIDQFQNPRHAAEKKPSVETKEKETSIDSDIMPVPVDTRETLAAQRMRVQTVLRDMAMEIACLIGKNLSSDTLSSFSELDATPLHCLITDLKKEIESKDQVLVDRRGYIDQLEQEILVTEKELHRLKLRQKTVDNDRLSYEKRIANLQRALQDHDEAISSLKQYNLDLQQHVEDMKDTLQTYKESIRRLSDEKASLEDECKNQLITISNLRTALEETKRNGSSSVSLPSILGGSSSSSPNHSGPNSQYLQPQHHYYTSNNTNNSNINNNHNDNTSSGTSYWSAFWRAMHDS